MLEGSGTKASYWLQDGTTVRFGTGPGTPTHRDDWCVFVHQPNGTTQIPSDVSYFRDLKQLGERHGIRRVYDAFVVVYDMTTQDVDPRALSRIAELSEAFGDDALLFHKTMAIIYFAMVAEENKRPEHRWPMKKRVKKLGVHELLICGFTPEQAANASRGKSARDNLARLRSYESQEEGRRTGMST